MLSGTVDNGSSACEGYGTSPNQPLPDSIGYGGGSARHIQLDEDITEVAIDCSGADDKGLGYFAVGLALGHEAQHVYFAVREVQVEDVVFTRRMLLTNFARGCGRLARIELAQTL